MVDIDNRPSPPKCLGGNAGDRRVFRSGVVGDDKTTIDRRFAPVDTDALVFAVANDAVLNRHVGAQRIDAIIIDGHHHTAHEATLLTGKLVMNINTVGII